MQPARWRLHVVVEDYHVRKATQLQLKREVAGDQDRTVAGRELLQPLIQLPLCHAVPNCWFHDS